MPLNSHESGGKISNLGALFMLSDPVSRTRELVGGGMRLKDACKQVAREFETTQAAVRLRYYRAGGNQLKAHGHCLLTDEQDQTLRIVALAFSGANLAWNKQLLAFAVTALFDIQPQRSWCNAWLERHADSLSPRKSKHLSKKRDATGMLAEVCSFIDRVEAVRQEVYMAAHLVVNYDETRVCVSSEGEMLLERVGKQRSHCHGQTFTTLGSLLPFVSADGSVICSFWILKAELGEDGEGEVDVVSPYPQHPSRGSWPVFIGYTDTGFVNGTIFAKCVDEFIRRWKLLHPHLHAWVFGDQLGCHAQLELTRRALNEGVALWFLPSNTSHFTQPLDHAIFATFKVMLRSRTYLHSIAALFSGNNPRQAFFSMALQVERDAFTPRVIKKGFTGTGLFPWNPTLILSNASANAGILEVSGDGVEARAVSAATTIVRQLASIGDDTARSARNYKIRVKQNDLHDPVRRLTYHDEEAKLIAEKKRARDEKSQAAAESKRQRVEERAKKTCAAVNCGAVSRGGKAWRKCSPCSLLFCPAHLDAYAVHHQTCAVQELP